MPQLMPFYWINSVFMIFLVLFTFVIFYYLKVMEKMYEMYKHENIEVKYNLLW